MNNINTLKQAVLITLNGHKELRRIKDRMKLYNSLVLGFANYHKPPKSITFSSVDRYARHYQHQIGICRPVGGDKLCRKRRKKLRGKARC